MHLVDAAMRVVHALFAGVWTGGTVLVGGVVSRRDGRLEDRSRWLLGRFTRR